MEESASRTTRMKYFLFGRLYEMSWRELCMEGRANAFRDKNEDGGTNRN